MAVDDAGHLGPAKADGLGKHELGDAQSFGEVFPIFLSSWSEGATHVGDLAGCAVLAGGFAVALWRSLVVNFGIKGGVFWWFMRVYTFCFLCYEQQVGKRDMVRF